MTAKPKLLFFYCGLLWCWGLLAITLYMQYGMKLDPCPLCIMQRIILFFLGILFIIACLHRPGKLGQNIYCILILLVAILGTAIAGRHVWLQHNPQLQMESCGADLSYLLKTVPMREVLQLLLKGTSECNKVDWHLLGLSLAELSLLNFILMSSISGYLIVYKRFVVAK